jgi:hypothetical protein
VAEKDVCYAFSARLASLMDINWAFNDDVGFYPSHKFDKIILALYTKKNLSASQ